MKVTRREFLKQAGMLSGAATLGFPSSSWANAPVLHAPKGKADYCLFLWLSGGMCQIDTWDPKKRSTQRHPIGSHYDAISTAVPGVKVCEHLPLSARMLDKMTIVRSMSHRIGADHGAATYWVHTGRSISGTVQYPSIGSVIAHERGPIVDGVPPYVVIGYPNISRAPGFLGAKAGYLYLTNIESGPNGLSRPPDVYPQRQVRREHLLAAMRSQYLSSVPEQSSVLDYNETIEQSLRLAGPKFMNVFNLGEEKDSLRNAYGGEFGQRCLLSRRLLESGVRFVEVTHNLNFINGTGWDTHNEGQQKQHLLIKELDGALTTLIQDLEERELLDRTLICAATEFGRPPVYDGRGGRGHHSPAFSVVLAGGGLKHGQAIGETNDVGRTVVSEKCLVPDLHASIYAAMGIDPAKNLYAGERPVPVTDGGKPLMELFA